VKTYGKKLMDKFGDERGSISMRPIPELVGYEWKYKEGEKFSEREGGLISGRISDWGKSERSSPTNREIVHVYKIKGVDGIVRTFGKQAAMKELGISNPSKIEKMAQKAKNEEEYNIYALNSRKNELIRRAEKGIDKSSANQYFYKAGYNEKHLPNSVFMEKDGKFIRVLTGPDVEILNEIGFTVYGKKLE
jgi:hypothetical protein